MNIINIFKKGSIPLKSGVDTWIVHWTAKTGIYYSDTVEKYQAFTDKQEAADFAESIRRAHKLIGNKGKLATVSVDKSSHIGLNE